MSLNCINSFQYCGEKQTCAQENGHQLKRKSWEKIPAEDPANEVDLSKECIS